jgi:hypothetical protein
MRAFLDRFPFHPLLFALFPPIAFLAWNIDEMRPGEIVRPIVACLILGSGLLIIFRILLRDMRKAALATSMMLLVLLAYGQVYSGLKQIGMPPMLTRHRYLVPVLALAVVLALLALRRRPLSAVWTSGANMMGLILLVGPLVGLAGHAVRARQVPVEMAGLCGLQLPAGKPPDVYLVVLDAYERGDVLRSLNDYDNEPFLDGLRQRGFYVAEGSMSNYRHTKTSLASTLNMDYVQDFPKAFGARPDNPWDIVQQLKNSVLRRSLECLGYRTVALGTGFPYTELTDADYFFRYSPGGPGLTGVVGPLAASERVFLGTTLVRALTDGQVTLGGFLPTEALDPDTLHRQQVSFALDQLPELAKLPSPKFVFVHVVSPHPPFVFGPNGEPLSAAQAAETDPKTLYANQVAYLNGRVLEGLDSILANSEVPPIIVIMGDHGYTESNPESKMSILNAYHLPDGGARGLYPTITPVNSFRVVLNEYFGGAYSLLPDISYYSTGVDDFRYAIIPNTWIGH